MVTAPQGGQSFSQNRRAFLQYKPFQLHSRHGLGLGLDLGRLHFPRPDYFIAGFLLVAIELAFAFA